MNSPVESTIVIWSGTGLGVTIRGETTVIDGIDKAIFVTPAEMRLGGGHGLYAVFAGRLDNIEIDNHDYEPDNWFGDEILRIRNADRVTSVVTVIRMVDSQVQELTMNQLAQSTEKVTV